MKHGDSSSKLSMHSYTCPHSISYIETSNSPISSLTPRAIVKVLQEIRIYCIPLLFLFLTFLFMVPVGDFGLATSSLAAVDPSDVASPSITLEADMTLGSLASECVSSQYSDMVYRGRNKVVYRSWGTIETERKRTSRPFKGRHVQSWSAYLIC